MAVFSYGGRILDRAGRSRHNAPRERRAPPDAEGQDAMFDSIGTEIYRLVAFGADGTKRLLCRGLPGRARAEQVIAELKEVSPFFSLAVEADHDMPGPRPGSFVDR